MKTFLRVLLGAALLTLPGRADACGPWWRQAGWAAFTKATVVGNDETPQAAARTLAETEPTAREELLRLVGRPTPEDRRFDAQVLVMGLPLLSPFLKPGDDRDWSTDPKLNLTVDVSYQRNWWCAPVLPKESSSPLAFVSEEERQAALAEWNQGRLPPAAPALREDGLGQTRPPTCIDPSRWTENQAHAATTVIEIVCLCGSADNRSRGRRRQGSRHRLSPRGQSNHFTTSSLNNALGVEPRKHIMLRTPWPLAKQAIDTGEVPVKSNLKPFLAFPLLCLAPALAVATESGANDFVALRSEYVSLHPAESVELPALRGDEQSSTLLADVTQTFYIGNWTGMLTYPAGSLTGSSVPFPLPNPLNFTTPYTYSGSAQARVPALTSWTQVFGYTTNPADPYGQAKTCIWQVSVSVTNGVCSANVTTSAYGQQGVTCLLDNASNVNPASCQLFVGVGLQ